VYFPTYSVWNLAEGDSVQFPGSVTIGGGIPPLNWYLSPSTGLSDPYDLTTWCKTMVSTDYNLIAIDSVGCVSQENLTYQIRIIPTDLGHEIMGHHSLALIKNTIVFANPKNKMGILSVFEASGRRVLKTKIAGDSYSFEKQMFPTGKMYLIELQINGERYVTKYFPVE
jgi:hypothetical protein